MLNPDDPKDSGAADSRRVAAHCSLRTQLQFRLLTGALNVCRNALPADANPDFVARIHDLDRRLAQLIADAGSPNLRCPPIKHAL